MSSKRMASAASWRVSLRLDDQPLMLGNKTLTLGHALFGLNKLPQENSRSIGCASAQLALDQAGARRCT